MLDYFVSHMWQLWAILSVVCLILELTAGDFFIICFSIGAIFACLTDALGGGIVVQLAVFAAFTLASLFFVRPFAVRFLHKGEPNRVSNADALLGRKGRVVEVVRPTASVAYRSTATSGRPSPTRLRTSLLAQTYASPAAKAPSSPWKGLKIDN